MSKQTYLLVKARNTAEHTPLAELDSVPIGYHEDRWILQDAPYSLVDYVEQNFPDLADEGPDACSIVAHLIVEALLGTVVSGGHIASTLLGKCQFYGSLVYE